MPGIKVLNSIPAKNSESDSKGITILLVEDDTVNRLLLKIIVSKIHPDIHILEAENGKLAVEQCRKQVPDLIFMDINMPVLNGYEATLAIRKLKHGKRVPIIAFTARALKSDRDKCIDLGINDHLSKPVIFETIEKTIYKWLSQKLK